jgi:adenosylmethionine-8-amino-7-oxononanoate aminotransferase
VVPDIMCLAKGLTGGALPLAATLAKEALFAAHYAPDRAKMFFHSSSFTANPVACAAARANIAIWQSGEMAGQLATLSANMAEGIDGWASHPALENVRQLGTIVAADLRAPSSGYLSEVAPALRAWFLERCLLLRPLGNSIYLMPPYCTDAAQIARLCAAVGEAADHFG